MLGLWKLGEILVYYLNPNNHLSPKIKRYLKEVKGLSKFQLSEYSTADVYGYIKRSEARKEYKEYIKSLKQ